MKSQLYITEYNLVKSKSQQKIKKNNINKPFKESSDSTSFITKNKEFKSMKENMLDYIIKEETQFVDLFKCEKFYRDLNYRNKSEINTILSEQSRKRIYLESLHKQIEKEIILNIEISKDAVIENFEQEMKNYNNEMYIDYKLSLKEKFNYEHYQNIHNQLLQESIQVKEKIIECKENSDKNKELYQKYMIIKQKAQMSLIHQKGVFNEIREFDKIREEKYKEDLAEKKSKFKDLEYQVFKVKSETIEIEKNLESMKQRALQTINNIKIVKIKNQKLGTENRIMKREYNLRKIFLLRMFKQFEVKSLDEVINLFNEESRWYISNFNLYINLNKEISQNNIVYAELNTKYLKIKEEVEILKSGVVLDDEEELDKSFVEDPLFKKISSDTADLIKKNEFLSNQVFHKHNLIKAFSRLVYKYYPKLIKFKNSQEETTKRSNLQRLPSLQLNKDLLIISNIDKSTEISLNESTI